MTKVSLVQAELEEREEPLSHGCHFCLLVMAGHGLTAGVVTGLGGSAQQNK